jgi:hypothetical protein
MQFPMATVKKNALYMRDKYDLFSTTIGKNLVFNKLKECMQKLKFNDSKCSLGYYGYVLIYNATTSNK